MRSSTLALPFSLATLALGAPQNPTVQVGAAITGCTVPGTIALTFDDGPAVYTDSVLDLLAQHDARATFFVLGTSLQTEYASRLHRMIDEGHQVASHTQDHLSLTNLSPQGMRDQMNAVDDSIREIIGQAPTYMRPPYLETNDQVNSVMTELAYHVISADIDTKDYMIEDDPAMLERSYDKFVGELDAGGSIVLMHDIHSVVTQLAERILVEAQARGLSVVPVGECLGAAPGSWYKD